MIFESSLRVGWRGVGIRWCHCGGKHFHLNKTQQNKSERKVVVQSNGLINLLQLTTILYFL